MATSTLGSGTLVLAGTTSGTTTVTATAVAGTTTLTLPAATDTLVGKATTDTLTNKTLTGAVMNGTLGATTPSTVAATTISASSTATFAAGAAGTPSITTTGDTNTGIFFPAADTIAFAEGGAEVARFDSSGNFGLGVTPSAWTSPFKVIESGNGSTFQNAIAFQTNNNTVNLMGNCYYDGSYRFKYGSGSATASQFVVNSNSYVWNLASGGTAGGVATFTQAMTLDASGNLGLGTTSPYSTAGYTSVTLNNATNGAQFRMRQNNSDVGMLFNTSNTFNLYTFGAVPMVFYTNDTERARIDSSGNLLVGVTSGSNTLMAKSRSGNRAFSFVNSSDQNIFYTSSNTTMSSGENGANAAGYFGKDSGTNRSVNAAGTVNASGADYAEYMTKAGDFTVSKGDVVGINAEGKLTNVFADAVSFVVKSTDPSYVGGDVWGNAETLGMSHPESLSGEATDEEKIQYETDKAAFEAALEAARQLVDRIAFAGQVPVNVTGATAGQYIIPVNNNGAIKGEAVNEAEMTLAQYMKAVGKVIAIESDGRAKIIVKVA
jgi:hypothetical protein